MEGAPDLEIIPTVIDGSWKVFLHNMFPVPFGIHVKIAFGEPIARDGDDDPGVIVDQCREWADGVLKTWDESTGATA
jgi:hypothetical protein